MASAWLTGTLSILSATISSATPLIFTAMGGVLSERAGVVNIALEGLMLTGAFVGIWLGQSSPAMGLVAALAAGGLLGFVHAVLTQKTRANHVVSGLGITLLAMGGTQFLFQKLFPATGIEIQPLNPGAFAAIALALPFALAYTLRNTRFGLRLRAVGESPETARMTGVSPFTPRAVAVTLSGVLAAAGGAYLSMAEVHRFSPGMSAGKGYIALAAVIFGKWSPVGAAVGSLFFGFFDALQGSQQINGAPLTWLGIEWSSPYLLGSLPYLMTLAALVTVVGRAKPPAALGAEE